MGTFVCLPLLRSAKHYRESQGQVLVDEQKSLRT